MQEPFVQPFNIFSNQPYDLSETFHKSENQFNSKFLTPISNELINDQIKYASEPLTEKRNQRKSMIRRPFDDLTKRKFRYKQFFNDHANQINDNISYIDQDSNEKIRQIDSENKLPQRNFDENFITKFERIHKYLQYKEKDLIATDDDDDIVETTTTHSSKTVTGKKLTITCKTVKRPDGSKYTEVKEKFDCDAGNGKIKKYLPRTRCDLFASDSEDDKENVPPPKDIENIRNMRIL